jgi:hypothetical protein
MKYSLLWVAVTLILSSLACGFTIDGPTPPASPIPVSTEAVGELQDLWKSAATNVPIGNDMVITTNEQQLTSLVALRLQEQENPPITDPQVFLRDGKIQLYGTAHAGDIKTSALIVISVTITPEGAVQFKAESADFGPLPVPTALLDTVSSTINEAFTGNIGSTATGLKIKAVLIADGQMTITAVLTR